MTTLLKSTSALARQIRQSTLWVTAKIVKKKHLLPYVGSLCLTGGILMSEAKQFELNRGESLKQSEALGTCYEIKYQKKKCNVGKPTESTYSTDKTYSGACSTSPVYIYGQLSRYNQTLTTPPKGVKPFYFGPWAQPCGHRIRLRCEDISKLTGGTDHRYISEERVPSDDTYNMYKLGTEECDETGK